MSVTSIDPTRLYTALLNTGLQSKDNPLYQVIHDLIQTLSQVSSSVNTVSDQVSNTPNPVSQNILTQLSYIDEDNEQWPQGIGTLHINANTLEGTTLASNVVNSSLTSVGALNNLTVTNNATVGSLTSNGFVSGTNGSFSGTSAFTVATGQAPFTVSSTDPVTNLSIGGNSGTATALKTARTINGVSFNGTSNINIPDVAAMMIGLLDNDSSDDFNIGIPFRVISASELTTGTLADARLSSNVPLLNAVNSFTKEQIISGVGTLTGLTIQATTTLIPAIYLNNATTGSLVWIFATNTKDLKILTSGGAQSGAVFYASSGVSLADGTSSSVDPGAGNLRVYGKIITDAILSLPNTGGAASCGQLTLVAGTKTINTTAATSTCLIFFQRVANGGTIGFETTYTKVNGVSFTVSSDNILDTSVYNWLIVETH